MEMEEPEYDERIWRNHKVMRGDGESKCDQMEESECGDGGKNITRGDMSQN